MFELRCTVRNCTELLARRDQSLVCSAGHCFDRAKYGYWNLLQPQDRKSKHPGDSDEAVLARQRWLARGYAEGLVSSLKAMISITGREGRTLDLGCGEGTFGQALFADSAERYCGIDLSKRAIRLASRAWPGARWVLANADRTLPAADQSVSRVLSLFGRRPVEEIGRVLTPGGYCLFAVPGQTDLIELREQTQQAGHRRSRWESIVFEFQRAGFELIEHRQWQQQVHLGAEAIADALAMTYRAVRHSQRARIATVTEMKVTLSADLLLLRLSIRSER